MLDYAQQLAAPEALDALGARLDHRGGVHVDRPSRASSRLELGEPLPLLDELFRRPLSSAAFGAFRLRLRQRSPDRDHESSHKTGQPRSKPRTIAETLQEERSVADNDEREQRNSDEPPPAKPSASRGAELTTEQEILQQLKEIRALLTEGRELQSRYLWILFPIGAIMLVQTILQATRF
jgi:hypothetical protein